MAVVVCITCPGRLQHAWERGLAKLFLSFVLFFVSFQSKEKASVSDDKRTRVFPGGIDGKKSLTSFESGKSCTTTFSNSFSDISLILAAVVMCTREES